MALFWQSCTWACSWNSPQDIFKITNNKKTKIPKERSVYKNIPYVTKQQIQQKKKKKENLIIRTQEYNNNKWDILSVTKLEETDSFHKWQAFNYACNIWIHRVHKKANYYVLNTTHQICANVCL